MKKMRQYLAFVMVATLLLTFAGCGDPEPTTAPTTAPTTVPTTAPTTAPTEPPMTADQLIANINAAMADTAPSQMYMEMGYNVSVTQDGVTEEAKTSIVMDTRTSTDPFGSYILSDVGIASAGFEMNITVEMYTVEEEGTVVVYTQAMGYWSREDTGMTVSDFIGSGQMESVSTDALTFDELSNLTLEPTTSTHNDTEVYVLHAVIESSEMSEALAELGIGDPSVLESITMPITLYVDAENWTILRLEADMNSLADVLIQVALGEMPEEETENTTIQLTIPPIVYEVCYGPVEIPAVPQEAYDETAGNDDISGGLEEDIFFSGPAVLYAGDEMWEIVENAGWTVTGLTDDYIWIYNEDFTKSGEYSYEITDYDDFMTRIQYIVDYMEEFEIYVSHGQGPAIDGYKTWEIIGTDEAHYYALRETGDGWVCVYAVSYYGADSELLSYLISFMTPYAE